MRESLRIQEILIFVTLIFVTLLCSSCGSGSSEGFVGAGLDQFYDPLSGPTTDARVGTSSQAAQTFTVGASGTLEFVEVFLSQSLPGASLTLDLRPQGFDSLARLFAYERVDAAVGVDLLQGRDGPRVPLALQRLDGDGEHRVIALGLDHLYQGRDGLVRARIPQCAGCFASLLAPLLLVHPGGPGA